MSFDILLAAGMLVTLGSLVQSSLGFGLAVVAAPLLIRLDPQFIPGPMILLALVLSILNTVRHRRALNLRPLLLTLLGRLPGTVGGIVLLGLINQQTLLVFVGLGVIGAVLVSSTQWHPRITPITAFCAGLLSGFMGTTTSIGGPPIALIYQGEKGPMIRANLSAYFSISCLISLIALRLSDHLSNQQISWGLTLVPFAVGGFLLAAKLIPYLTVGWLRRGILLLCLLSGLSALWSGVS